MAAGIVNINLDARPPNVEDACIELQPAVEQLILCAKLVAPDGVGGVGKRILAAVAFYRPIAIGAATAETSGD